MSTTDIPPCPFCRRPPLRMDGDRKDVCCGNKDCAIYCVRIPADKWNRIPPIAGTAEEKSDTTFTYRRPAPWIVDNENTGVILDRRSYKPGECPEHQCFHQMARDLGVTAVTLGLACPTCGLPLTLETV